jgi:hypothetical protein
MGPLSRPLPLVVRPLFGGRDDPDCLAPLCWMRHRAHVTGRLELLPNLKPRFRTEVAHALMRLGRRGVALEVTWQTRRNRADP